MNTKLGLTAYCSCCQGQFVLSAYTSIFIHDNCCRYRTLHLLIIKQWPLAFQLNFDFYWLMLAGALDSYR